MTNTEMVQGTLFTFPSLPDEDSAGVRLATQRRESVLRKAQAVRPFKPGRKSSWITHDPSGSTHSLVGRASLLTATIEVPAGTVIEVSGSRAEVWSPGYLPRSVWAVLESGTFVLARRGRPGVWCESGSWSPTRKVDAS